ncbi:YhgE/Pip domain-containing protein [Paenarthrobacter sp. DKR-5]|uniref:YhgE/Pip domain-containing protein n=1 Tax=Paenarthrobacter sp. DKR-5 TaxID=2835535 RepID=UPI001BDC957D|nr:YhgE/Pip domain-containing protein [Paenarthrobacter sp. DKR-5]MBT1003572.1 YhgE/Pip domain-containing protein [Paenarthrobacter sp. DKR-5]
MTVLRLAQSELKRMTGGLLPKLTVLALVMVPLLYGAVYLYANWDPYGHLDQIKAALVNEDTGAAAGGKQLDVGGRVTSSLVDAKTFDWQRVPSAAAADEGVRSGKYAFALKIPKDFSRNLASPSSFDSARQAMLNVTTNDANNYLLSTIVDKLTGSVHNTVAKEVGQETANQLLTGLGTIHTQLVSAADGAGRLADGAGQLKDGSAKLADGTGRLLTGARSLHSGQQQLTAGADQLSSGAARLSSGLSQLHANTSTLPADAAALADGAAKVAAGNAKLNAQVQSLGGTVDELEAANHARVAGTTSRLVAAGALTQAQADQVLAGFDSTAAAATAGTKAKLAADTAGLQQLAAGSAAVADGAAKLSAAAPALDSAVTQANAGAASLASGAQDLTAGQRSALDGSAKLADGAAQVNDGAASARTGAAKLADGSGKLAAELDKGAGKVPNPDAGQKQNVSNVIADPVSVNTLSQAKAGTYGAGLAPFFLTLAMWIGIFMLVQAMRPVTQRALASNARSWKIAMGGWLPFFAVSAVQASLLMLVVRFGLGLDPAHPVLTWLFLLLGAMTFSAIIQGIVALLGTPGKFVVLILLVLQLVSSGGTFPWETTPGPLHLMHDILPMGYVVSGMRHLIYGSDVAAVAPIAVGLLLYTAFGAALSTLAVHRHKFWTLKRLQPEIEV